MVLYSGLVTTVTEQERRLCRSGGLAMNNDRQATTLVEIELLRWSTKHETKQQLNTNIHFVKWERSNNYFSMIRRRFLYAQ